MISQEAVGAVPQPGVNPQAQQQKPAAPSLSPQEVEALRTDPEIIEAVSKFLGKPTTLENVPGELLAEFAGMVEKLGVDGAVQLAQQMIPPDAQAKIRSAI